MPVGGSRAWLWRPWAAAGPGRGTRGRWQRLGDTKSARNFPRSLLKTAQKRSNSNDANSNTEIVTGELRAKLLSSRQDGATHSRTSHTAGVEAPEGRRAGLRCPWAAAGPGRAAVPVGGGGAWPGFEATRRAGGSRRGRLAGGPPPTGTPSSPAPQQGPTAPGTPAAPQATQCTPRHASNPAPQMRDGVSPTQSGGRV